MELKQCEKCNLFIVEQDLINKNNKISLFKDVENIVISHKCLICNNKVMQIKLDDKRYFLYDFNLKEHIYYKHWFNYLFIKDKQYVYKLDKFIYDKSVNLKGCMWYEGIINCINNEYKIQFPIIDKKILYDLDNKFLVKDCSQINENY